MAREVLNGLNVRGPAQVFGRNDAVQLSVRANGTQTAELQQWQDSGGNPILKIDSGGSLVTTNVGGIRPRYITRYNNTGTYMDWEPGGGLSLVVAARDTGDATLGVRGTSGQTADLQQWQNDAPTTLARVTVAGLGDFSTAGLRTKHETAATPTGGNSGEVRVGTDKLWVQDAGTWKSVAVSAAGAPSFASTVKWWTD